MIAQSISIAPAASQPRQPRLLDRVRAALRVRHYSLRTEECYIQWIRRFILFHHKRHPLEMGAAEINAFLTDLAVVGRVSASTQNQAFSALLFLYQKVLEVDPGRIASFAEHHIFPQAYRSWFARGGIDVDRYLVRIDRTLHEAIHAGKNAYGRGGWYNRTVMDALRQTERAAGRRLTPRQIEEIVFGLLPRFGLPMP
jgi:hypothetical protein